MPLCFLALLLSIAAFLWRMAIITRAEEEPQDESDEQQATNSHCDFRRIHFVQFLLISFLSTRKPRRRKAFDTTLTEDSAIAAEAIMGLSSQPVKG